MKGSNVTVECATFVDWLPLAWYCMHQDMYKESNIILQRWIQRVPVVNLIKNNYMCLVLLVCHHGLLLFL